MNNREEIIELAKETAETIRQASENAAKKSDEGKSFDLLKLHKARLKVITLISKQLNDYLNQGLMSEKDKAFFFTRVNQYIGFPFVLPREYGENINILNAPDLKAIGRLIAEYIVDERNHQTTRLQNQTDVTRSELHLKRKEIYSNLKEATEEMYMMVNLFNQTLTKAEFVVSISESIKKIFEGELAKALNGIDNEAVRKNTAILINADAAEFDTILQTMVPRSEMADWEKRRKNKEDEVTEIEIPPENIEIEEADNLKSIEFFREDMDAVRRFLEMTASEKKSLIKLYVSERGNPDNEHLKGYLDLRLKSFLAAIPEEQRREFFKSLKEIMEKSRKAR